MAKTAQLKTLYVRVPAEIHRAAKIRAVTEGRLLSDIVTEALQFYLETKASGLAQPTQVSQPKSLKEPTEPKNPKSHRPPPATLGPGSLGYVPPMPALEGEGEESLSEPLPIATDDENPFADDGSDDDLLPDERG